MKIIYNKYIPFKGFKCVNLFGVLFVRTGSRITARDFRHELIHTAQMKELLYVPFYLLYVLEWLVRLLICKGDTRKAYRTLSYEREAYAHEGEADYLKRRKPYNEYKQR